MSGSRSAVLILAAAAATGGLAACAGRAGPSPAVTPEELASLDRELRQVPPDADALTRIGVRFYEAQAYDRARDVLSAALRLRPAFTTAVYLGLALEGAGRFDDAEASYRAARTLAGSNAQRRQLDGRLAALGQARLAADARDAIAREAELSAQPPVPNSVAILPWTYVGADRRLQALGRGVPHLLLTDLGKIASLTLIERERVQALLDEIALGRGGRVDSTTAVRSGRLLRATWVVAGVVRETAAGIQLRADVYHTPDARLHASGSAGDRVSRLFELEKGLALDLVDQLGVPVTPAERRAVSDRPTEDVQAFLAFSDGLAAQARGDYRSAGSAFALAAGRDPAFGAARQFGETNRLLLGAMGSSPEALGRLAQPTTVAGAGSSRAASLYAAMQTIAPSTGGAVDLRSRPAITTPRLPEALGQDNPARIAIIGEIIIIIPRP